MNMFRDRFEVMHAPDDKKGGLPPTPIGGDIALSGVMTPEILEANILETGQQALLAGLELADNNLLVHAVPHREGINKTPSTVVRNSVNKMHGKELSARDRVWMTAIDQLQEEGLLKINRVKSYSMNYSEQSWEFDLLAIIDSKSPFVTDDVITKVFEKAVERVEVMPVKHNGSYAYDDVGKALAELETNPASDDPTRLSLLARSIIEAAYGKGEEAKPIECLQNGELEPNEPDLTIYDFYHSGDPVIDAALAKLKPKRVKAFLNDELEINAGLANEHRLIFALSSQRLREGAFKDSAHFRRTLFDLARFRSRFKDEETGRVNQFIYLGNGQNSAAKRIIDDVEVTPLFRRVGLNKDGRKQLKAILEQHFQVKF